MEEAVDVGYTTICCTCLATDRYLVSITSSPVLLEMFRITMFDFTDDGYGNIELEQAVCWECAAMLRRLFAFRQKAHTAQHHCRLIASTPATATIDHSFLPQPLSQLDTATKLCYDSIFVDYTCSDQNNIQVWSHETKLSNIADADIVLEDELLTNTYASSSELLNASEISLPVVVSTESMMMGNVPMLTVSPLTPTKFELTANLDPNVEVKLETDKTGGSNYTVIYISEEDLITLREAEKSKLEFAKCVYKCELCIIGFTTQKEVEEHFVSLHRAREGHELCRVCFIYVETKNLDTHIESHYTSYMCNQCKKLFKSPAEITKHLLTHAVKRIRRKVQITNKIKPIEHKKSSKKLKPGDLKKMLAKTYIEGYQCLECDLFFKTSRARKNHVAKEHREGLQCDTCKKRFVNRTTLTTHLKLHEGPQPRSLCPICHKMVRDVQIKYHIRRHETKGNFECVECNKVFQHIATYQAHFKYSRAHATDAVFKFPCPMCNRGYPTKEQMQDHFNYQHLGKTTHKCPICEKPIASKANVEKHIARVHSEKKEKPRNHQCNECGKRFTDKKALTQHTVIHSGERPLTCDVCAQTFKQKASLYTHRKRVHKLVPSKHNVQYIKQEPVS